MKEIFKYHSTYYIRSKRHDLYVSNLGNVKDNDKLKLNPTKVGNERIYIAVAKLFIPNPDNKPQIDHIDTNRNNNRVDNLRWVTNKENSNNDITRRHYSEAAKKRWENKEYKDKVHTFSKGNTPWNKGITGYKTKPCSEERKNKISEAHKNKHKVWNDETKTSYHYE